MNTPFRKLSFLLLAASVILNSACSSDDSSSGPTNATITDENAQALATAGTEGVKQAVNSSSLSPFAKINNPSLAQQLTVLTVQQASQDPALATNPNDFCPGGGTATGFDTIGQNGGTVTYDNCIIGDVTIDGTMNITTSTSGDIITYSITANFTFTYSGEVETIDYSSTCTINQTAGTVNCTYDSEALGIDGRSYTVSDVNISGDNTIGYTISATVTDPDNGIITIRTITPVKLDCPNGQPSLGEIEVSDGTNTMIVTFNNCDSYSINFNGSTTTHNW